MRLTKAQRSTMEAWLAENMTQGNHTATWAANELAPMLGLGKPPLGWDVLHPLATEVRSWCKARKVKPHRGEPVLTYGYEHAEEKGWDVRETRMRDVECTACGRRFPTTRDNARRCPECAAAGRYGRKREPKLEKECEVCGKSFRTDMPHAKYCSQACKAEHDRERKREIDRKRKAELEAAGVVPKWKVPRVCEVCGKEFTPTCQQQTHVTVCSPECKRERHRRYMDRYHERERRKRI